MKLLTETLNSIEPASAEFREQATRRIESLTMPHWALGRLLDLAVDLAGMTRSLEFPVARKTVVLMAGDHGIVTEGVTPQPSSVTVQMVHNFVAGGAGINAVARSTGTRVVVADLGVAADLSGLVSAGKIFDCKVAPGTCNFAKGPAMTRLQAVASLEAGIGLARRLAPETDVFGSGEMGIGNTSPSSAIVAVLSRQDPGPLVGPGAALPQSRLAHKAEVIRRGIALNQPDPADGVDVLAKVGGFEIGGIAGLALGAAALRKPMMVDGFISSAGALIAAAISPAVKDYLILAHGSSEPGHRTMARLLGKKPLLDLGLHLGEGSGAALAMPLLDAAREVLTGMATFESANVTSEGVR